MNRRMHNEILVVRTSNRNQEHQKRGFKDLGITTFSMSMFDYLVSSNPVPKEIVVRSYPKLCFLYSTNPKRTQYPTSATTHNGGRPEMPKTKGACPERIHLDCPLTLATTITEEGPKCQSLEVFTENSPADRLVRNQFPNYVTPKEPFHFHGKLCFPKTLLAYLRKIP